MKKAVILMLVLLTACQISTSFPDIFLKIKALDESHHTSFMTEKLNGSVVDSLEIPKFIAALQELKSQVSRSNAIDKNASLYLIRARIDMLESEQAWQTSNILNTKRRLKEHVLCDEAELVRAHSEYLGKAVAEAVNATLNLDDLIANYPEYRNLVGYNENKSKFYLSPTCYYGHYSRLEQEAITNICYNQSANATSRTIVNIPPPFCITP